MNKRKVICWDLDETVGLFRNLGRMMHDKVIPPDKNSLSLRPGIKDVLGNLQREGYAQVITTSAIHEYAHMAVEKTGLSHFFSRIFARNSMGYSSKSYKCVADNFRFSDAETASDMIIVGNSSYDQPADLDKTVLIKLDEDCCLDAIVAEKIIKKLLIAGNTDFNKGFYKIYANGNRTDIGDGISFKTDYCLLQPCRKSPGPIITDIRADSYKKSPEVINFA